MVSDDNVIPRTSMSSSRKGGRVVDDSAPYNRHNKRQRMTDLDDANLEATLSSKPSSPCFQEDSPTADDSTSSDMCVVCQESDKSASEYITLPCNHRYCGPCIAQWCGMDIGSSCPYCRRSLVYPVCGHRVEIEYFYGTAMNEHEFDGACRACAPTRLLQEYRRRHPGLILRREFKDLSRRDRGQLALRWYVQGLAEHSLSASSETAASERSWPTLETERNNMRYIAFKVHSAHAKGLAEVAGTALMVVGDSLRDLYMFEECSLSLPMGAAELWDLVLHEAAVCMAEFCSLPEVKAYTAEHDDDEDDGKAEDGHM